MIVLIRADATLEIGTGHVMRCAALGMRLLARGAQVHFVCAPLQERLRDWLRDQGFVLTVLADSEAATWRADLAATSKIISQVSPNGPVDLLVVDHYRLTCEWEDGLRSHVRRILVIDDLANRKHNCDLLLDQNLHDNANKRYEHLLPEGTIQFLGPQYALLRSEFDTPGLLRERNGKLKRLLVFLGGTDPGNQTAKVVDALRKLGDPALASTLVLGPAHPNRDMIHGCVAGLQHVTVLDATDRMSQLMADADLAIGTCGIAAWERCWLGLPSLVVITAENQREDAEILHRMGAVVNLGDAKDVFADDWFRELKHAIEQPRCMQTMGTCARQVMAGRHAALTKLEGALLNGMH